MSIETGDTRALVPLRLAQVGKVFGRRTVALHATDLRLRPGEVTVVTGQNGSGKSTLLRLIAGLSRPTCGRVHDRPARVAYVPDRFSPPRALTGRSYLNLVCAIRGVAAGARVDRTAEVLGLRPSLDVAMGTLSRGNAHKVALAQAMLAGADLLVLDEPAATFDSATRGALAGVLADHAARGRIVVVAAPEEARSPSWRMVRLVNGGVSSDTEALDSRPCDR